MKREQIEKKSVVTVSHDGLSFNVITAEVLHRAKYVRVLLNAATGQLAVQATTEAGLYSARFYREEVFKSNRIKNCSTAMKGDSESSRMARRWEPEYRWSLFRRRRRHHIRAPKRLQTVHKRWPGM